MGVVCCSLYVVNAVRRGEGWVDVAVVVVVVIVIFPSNVSMSFLEADDLADDGKYEPVAVMQD